MTYPKRVLIALDQHTECEGVPTWPNTSSPAKRTVRKCCAIQQRER